jgi:hypothetical protein
MARSSLMDLFEAGARAASPFLQADTARLRERNDLELRNEAASFANDLQDWMRDNPYAGDFEGYLGKLQKFAGDGADRRMARNGSPYYQRQMRQMRAQALEAARGVALAEQDRWRIEQAGVDYAKRLTEIDNNPNLDAKADLEWRTDALNLYGEETGGLSPADRAKEEAAIYNRAFDRRLRINIEGAATVAQAHKWLEDSVGALEEAVAGRGGSAADLDKYVANRRERLAGAMDAAEKAIWKREFAALDTDDNEYRRLAHDAVASGNYEMLLAAQGMYLMGVARREAAKGGRASEYDPADQPRIAGMFPVVGGLFGEREGGGGSARDRTISDLRDFFKRVRREMGIGGVLHKNGVTYERAAQEFEDLFVKMTEAHGFDRAQADLLFAAEANIDGFMGDLKYFIKEVHPEFNTDVINGITAAVKRIARNVDDDTREMLVRQVSREIYNTVADIGLGRLTDEEWIEKGKGIATRAVGREIALMDARNNEAVRNMDLPRHIRTIEQAKENPDAIGIFNGQVSYIGHEQNYDLWAEYTERDVATVLGIDPELAKASGWAEEEGRQDDIMAIPLVTVRGAADRDGTYKQDVVVEDDGTKRVATLRLDPETKKWEEVSRLSGGEALRERDRAEAESLRNIGREDGAKVWADAILSQPAGRQRRDEYNRIAPQVTRGSTAPDRETPVEWLYFEDELLMRGIDPDTLEPAREIPRLRYNEMLRRHPGQGDRIRRLDEEGLVEGRRSGRPVGGL